MKMGLDVLGDVSSIWIEPSGDGPSPEHDRFNSTSFDEALPSNFFNVHTTCVRPRSPAFRIHYNANRSLNIFALVGTGSAATQRVAAG